MEKTQKPVFGILFELFCRSFFSIYCPVSVIGRENLPKTSYILCSNHSSHLDAPALVIASGLPFEKFGIMAAKDYFFNPQKRQRWISSLFQILPIDRKATPESIAKSISLCREFCSQNERNLIIFPEGTRSLTGEIQRFKKGAALLACELNLPLVPAYIENTFIALPKGKAFPRPKKIQIIIGKPIETSPSYRKTSAELEEQISQLRDRCRLQI